MFMLAEHAVGQLPSLALMPGKIVGLEGPAGWGLTRVGLTLLAAPSQVGTVVMIDARGGWLSPLAAWEVGVKPGRLVVVRCGDRRLWARVTAAILEGVAAVYAEVPHGVGENELRRLAALTRARKAGLASATVAWSIARGHHPSPDQWSGSELGRSRPWSWSSARTSSGVGGERQVDALADV